MAQEPRFRETQRMRQPWILALLGLASVPTLVAGAVVGLGIILATVVFFFSIRLTTEVREDGVYVRFAPIHRSFRRLPFDEIERVERTEFGLVTYGGIGIRWTPNAMGYMTKQGTGIKIHRKDAKPVVIGSQETTRLLEAIETAN